MTNVKDIELEEMFNVYDLRQADRCDACPHNVSQAFVVAHKNIEDDSGTKRDHVILLCGHHFAKNEPALLAQGFSIQDHRDRINAKPMSGSNYQDA